MSPPQLPDLTQITNAINGLATTMQKGPWDYASTIAVVLTLVVLIWYTVETSRLRVAAQKQTEETEKLLAEAQSQNRVSASLLKEAQWQNETAVMPMLAVIHELSKDGRDRPIIAIQNAGPGTAFNLSADPVPSPTGTGELRVDYEGNVQMPGHVSSLRFHIKEKNSIVTGLRPSDLNKEIETGQLPNPLDIVLRCSSVTSVQYSFTFRFTPEAGTLKVTFEGFKTTFPGR